MKWAALIEYIPDKAKVDSIRPQHRAYLTGLLDAGKLACSGPLTDGYGALIVYEAETKEDAEALLRGDPFHDAGVFVTWVIHPWNMLFVNPKLVAAPS